MSSPSHRRGPWSQGEDDYLIRLVHTHGPANWVRIAQIIASRSPKQCRERWHQNLKPALNHDPISPEEGVQIERLVGEMGKRWADIARKLHGRSDNAVKNWWNGSMNRRRRLVLRRRTSGQHPSDFEEQSYPRSANRHLSITSSTYISHRGMDGCLPSPAASEGSRAESVDAAPSLISDNSSAFSISPRLATSPGIALPSLNSYPRDARRPSLPTLSFRPNYHNEQDSLAYTFAPRLHDPKPHNLSALAPIAYNQQHSYYHVPSPCSPHFHHEPRSHLMTAPPTPVQLPPLQMHAPPPPPPHRMHSQPLQLRAHYERPEPISKQQDSRMSVNSLMS